MIKEEANISVFDRGLMFGDGLFETLRIINGSPYLWSYHKARLLHGLDVIKIPVNIDDIHEGLKILIEKNRLKDALVKIIVTRGVGSNGYAPTNDITPNVIISSRHHYLSPNDPIDIFVPKLSYGSTGMLSQHKTLQKLSSVLTKIEAKENNCFEGLILDQEQNICEVSAGNIFWYKNKQLFTPCTSCGVVPGIMRKRIMELNDVLTGRFHVSEIISASAAFISNISWITLPVARIMPYGHCLNSTWLTHKIIEQIAKEDRL